jgi:hypothetical protein
MKSLTKQPAEDLDYDFDFSDFINNTAAGDTISTANVTADAGITLGTKTILSAGTTHKVKQWISGGVDGTSYVVTCRATTAAGRVKEKEFRLKVKEI